MRVFNDGAETAFGTMSLDVTPMLNGRHGLSVETTVLNLTRFFLGIFSVSSFKLDEWLVLDRNG